MTYKLVALIVFSFIQISGQSNYLTVLYEPVVVYQMNGFNVDTFNEISLRFDSHFESGISYNLRAGINLETPKLHTGVNFNADLNMYIYVLAGLNYYFSLSNRELSNLGLDTRFKFDVGIGINLSKQVFIELINYDIPNTNKDKFSHLFNLGLGYRFSL